MRNRRLARPPVLVALAVVLTLAGCGPAAPAQTEGQVFLTRTIDRALVLRSVRLQATLDPAGPLLGGAASGSLDADVDIEHTSAHVDAAAAGGDPALEVVVKDGVWWIDTGDGFRKQGGGMLPVPAGDDLRSAITGFATDTRIPVTATEAPCSVGTCRRLTADVPAQVVWDHFAAIARTFVAIPETPPADVPPAKVVIDTDPTTFDPIAIDVSLTIGTTPVRLLVEGTGFDQPLDIQPPSG